MADSACVTPAIVKVRPPQRQLADCAVSENTCSWPFDTWADGLACHGGNMREASGECSRCGGRDQRAGCGASVGGIKKSLITWTTSGVRRLIGASRCGGLAEHLLSTVQARASKQNCRYRARRRFPLALAVSAGVLPVASGASGEAPASTNICAMLMHRMSNILLERANPQANSAPRCPAPSEGREREMLPKAVNGVRPEVSVAATSAPCLNRSSKISGPVPSLTAQHSAGSNPQSKKRFLSASVSDSSAKRALPTLSSCKALSKGVGSSGLSTGGGSAALTLLFTLCGVAGQGFTCGVSGWSRQALTTRRGFLGGVFGHTFGTVASGVTLQGSLRLDAALVHGT